ncbi:MAG: sulfurtransferase TusA family protein [Candidatus Riflebacteria bacterium]|nr:sulfurtransferase TusA family protein [Candidatus Riflebacteria bacterium]
MATKVLNCLGLQCPQPILKMSTSVAELRPGDILQVSGDCPTFEDDVRKWVTRMKKTLLAVNRKDSAVIVQIQF